MAYAICGVELWDIIIIVWHVVGHHFWVAEIPRIDKAVAQHSSVSFDYIGIINNFVFYAQHTCYAQYCIVACAMCGVDIG